MKATIIYSTLIIALILNGCKNSSNKEKSIALVNDTIKELPIPQIPSLLNKEEAKINYLIEHYWDRVDFKDTVTIYDLDMLEQYWVNYIDRVLSFKKDSYEEILTKYIQQLNKGAKQNFKFHTDLADKYLYYPTSPLRNDQVYKTLCTEMLHSPHLSDVEKERIQYIIDLINKNNIGEFAENFKFQTHDGSVHQLNHFKNEFTILFFNNPGCNICTHVINVLKHSETINFLYNKKRLQIVAICPDGDTPEWREHTSDFPEQWINGYDPNFTLINDNLYDLRGIPSLYLLDSEHKVLVKDAQVEEILYKIEEIL